MIIHSGVAVLMQQLLHAAERDGSKVTWVFQLQEALQVGRCLAPSHIHTLTIYSIQPQTKTRSELKLWCVIKIRKAEQTVKAVYKSFVCAC